MRGNTIKISDVASTMERFTGEQKGNKPPDFSAWYRKLRSYFDTQKGLTDRAKLNTLVLLLDGSAFELYSSWTPDIKNSYHAVVMRLKEQYKNRYWENRLVVPMMQQQPNQSVSEFASKLEVAMAREARLNREPPSIWRTKCSRHFVSGLREDIRSALMIGHDEITDLDHMRRLQR